MKCPRCQAENRDGARFCRDCGAAFVAVCSGCGAKVEAGSKYCDSCGAPLAAVSGQPTASPRFASPESYTPKHLAEKILTSKSALEGERKLVTVLFADLKGSTELLADRDPEEARKLLDPVLERMMEAVHRYEGTVNQVMGDGIMALFGAPLAHEDHAVRACYAGLRMQESLKRYAEEVHRTAGVPIHIRVGVNSGDVVVRSIGSDLQMDYTAVGLTTHLAARLEQMAMPGSILISPETLNLAEGHVVVKPLGERPVKGLEAPLEVFEVVGAGTVRSRLQAAAARGLTRFVGRDAEMEELRRALERAGAGHGQVVAIVGEPGVGKSRLFWEFTHSHRTQGWLVVESSSVSYGKATAFLPLIELLRAYFQIEARDEARKIREKVTGKLLSLDRALESSLLALLWLLDVPVDDPEWQRLDPPQRRQQTLEGIKRLLLRESQVQPLLIVFEDLHWIDAETQALLDGVVESLPTARLLLLVNYRPEYQHGWGSKTYYRQLRIDPLPPESAEELLKVLLGNDPGLQPLKQLLIERTEGNPFFLEESVRTLIETKALAGERGAYHLARVSATLQIPATAQAILAARIDRLAPEDKRLLQAASVIGKDVPFTLLQSIAEVPEEGLRRSLGNLQTAEFLYEARLFPDLEYTFKHALTHEVAYGSLLQERRRTLHRQIVESIERLHPERLGEHIDQLAHHAFRGEAWDKAVTYLRQAGAKAFARSANREAATHLEQALTALDHLPEDGETRGQAIDLRIELRHALWPLGKNERILEQLHRAETLAEALGDQRRLARVLSAMGYSFWMLGDPDRVVAANQRALAIATSLGDFALEAAANLAIGLAYYGLGGYRRATEHLDRNIASLQGEREYGRFGTAGVTSVLSIMALAWCDAELGSFAEGIASGENALRIAQARDDKLSLMFADVGVGQLYLVQGDLARAIPTLERGLAICRTWDFPSWLPWLASRLGAAYVLAGRVTDGLPLLEQSMEQAASMGWKADASPLAARLSEAYLEAGRFQDASALATRALDLAKGHNGRGHQAWALRLHGEIASRRDPSDREQAEGHYRQALALAEELGMRPLVAHCNLGLGDLYRRTGDRAKAGEHLRAATGIYREMDMRLWLERAEGDTRELA
ncbi:MAG TPA: adenylate/guanylate cyclase domain-containing protein [Methylomirabilota bacterium]|nr:adenylate/guanylate cyclase domain-containing protein [Methylomirabilota bacterium]